MKKLVVSTLATAVILILSALALTLPASAVPCNPGDPGDATGDGYIDAGDITKVERIIFGWDAETPGSDANEDSTVNATDIGVVEYMILGIWPWNVVHLEMYDEEGNHVNKAWVRTNFTVVVYITYVEDLASAQYDIIYDASFLDIKNVTNGSVMEVGTNDIYPVDIQNWGFIPPATQGRVRIINNIPGGGVSGSGYLAKLHFYVNTSLCLESDINFSINASYWPDLFDSGSNPIAGVTWVNTSMEVDPCHLPCGEMNLYSTEGGSVVEPCECSYQPSPCILPAIVNISAEADPGYVFTEWTCDDGLSCCYYIIDNPVIDDIYSADTTVLFQAGCVFSVTAHFEPISTPTPTPTPTATASATPTATATATPTPTPTETAHYSLTIDARPAVCGWIEEPGEGTFVYPYGTQVGIEWMLTTCCCEFPQPYDNDLEQWHADWWLVDMVRDYDISVIYHPMIIDTLSCEVIDDSTVRLDWWPKCCSRYNDIRYSTSPIDMDNWGNATQCEGEPETGVDLPIFNVTGLDPGTTYYFRMKRSVDTGLPEGSLEWYDWSWFSNQVNCTTAGTAPTPSPSATPTASPTPPTGWDYHQQGNVTSSGACGNLSDYQMRLMLHYGGGTSNNSDVYLNGHCNADFSDVRFTRADGVSLLDYWVEEVTPGTNATVWVEFDNISTAGTQFYIYYGNPSASSASDGHNTFVFYEPFDNMDAWSIVAGNWNVSESVCHQTGGSGPTWEGGLKLDAPPSIDSRRVSCNMNLTNTEGDHYAAISVKWGDQSHFLHSELRKTSSPVHRCRANILGFKTAHEVSCDIEYHTWYRLTTGVDASGNVKVWIDGIEKQSFTDSDWDQTWAGINLHTYYSWADFDDLFVANYCDPEPAWGSWTPDASEPTPTPTATATATASATATPSASATATATATLLPCGYVSFFSTEGGSVTEPCECEYYQGKCYDGAVIDMLAEADPGYAFTQWTCDSGWCACSYSGGINTTGIEDFYAADTALHFMVGCIFEITAHFSPIATLTPTPTATVTATASPSASPTPTPTESPTPTCTARP